MIACARCARENPDDARFCNGCGAPLSTEQRGREERKVVTVPEAAIVARGQDRFVWTVVDGKAQESRVTVGARRIGVAEVEGLTAGTVVVTAGHTRLRNGASVEIVGNETAQVEG